MTKFRKRIGEKGVEKIFKISLMVNASEITEKELKQVMIDSTVQEKNITFPNYDKEEAENRMQVDFLIP